MNFLSESTEKSEAISSIGNYIKINDQEKSFTISSKAEKDKSSVEGKLTRQEQSSNNNIETLTKPLNKLHEIIDFVNKKINESSKKFYAELYKTLKETYKINDFEKEKIINSKITNIYYSKDEILEHIKKYL